MAWGGSREPRQKENCCHEIYNSQNHARSDVLQRESFEIALKWQSKINLHSKVEQVRTADDALLTVKLMIFFRLANIEKMLDCTRLCSLLVHVGS